MFNGKLVLVVFKAMKINLGLKVIPFLSYVILDTSIHIYTLCLIYVRHVTILYMNKWKKG